MTTPAPSIDFNNIKQWIALQETAQSEHGQAPVLTSAQLKAIAELNRAAAAALAPANPPPNLDDKNWVGLLHRYRDAHPTGVAVEFVDEHRGTHPLGGEQWSCYTSLPEADGMRFPGPGYGASADGSAPPFSKKKDAKQYAAYHAIQWLMLKEHMPNDGDNVTFPKSKPAAPSKSISVPRPASTPKAPSPSKARSPTAGASSPRPRSQKSAASSPTKGDEDSEETYIEKVEKLCDRLKFGRPSYEITAKAESDKLFDGKVAWGTENRVPVSVGTVKAVFGKRHAKQKMAQEIYQHLLQEENKRKMKAQEVFSTHTFSSD